MSAARVSFDVPPGQLDVDESGAITAVTAGGHQYLTGGGVSEVIIAGEPIRPSVERVALDADEIDIDLAAAGLSIAVRHAFAAGWGWRVRIANSTDHELIIDAAQLDLEMCDRMIGHPVAAGAEAELIIRPGDGSGPILAGRLQTGAITEITVRGPVVGPLRLPPGAGYVLTWQWTWYTDVARLLERRRGIVPWPTVRPVGEPVDLRGDPDAALIVPDDLIRPEESVQVPGGTITELFAERPGRYAIEERSARGTVAFSLGWTRPLERVLLERADQTSVGAGPTTAGLGTGQGIVLHAALTSGTASDPDDVEDALDLITGELADTGPRTGLDATLLTLEHHRTGDLDPLAAAVDWILHTDRVHPGLGFAVTQACLARVVRGEPIAAIIERATSLAAEISDPPRLPLDADGIAELELLAAIHRNIERPAPQLQTRLLAAGPQLSSGAVGPPRPPLDAEVQAALIATVLFAGEQAPALASRAWAEAPAVLAETAIPPLLLADDTDTLTSNTLAWLALSQLTR